MHGPKHALIYQRKDKSVKIEEFFYVTRCSHIVSTADLIDSQVLVWKNITARQIERGTVHWSKLSSLDGKIETSNVASSLLFMLRSDQSRRMHG